MILAMQCMQLHPVVQKDILTFTGDDLTSAVVCAIHLGKFRSPDVHAWVTAFELRFGRPPFAGTRLERLLDYAIFLESYDVPIDRCSEVTLEMKPLLGLSSGAKNQRVAGFMIDGKLHDVFLPMLQQTLAEAFQASVGMKGCGTFVFKNIMSVLAFQLPAAAISREIVDPEVQENGTDWVAAALAQETATVAEVSDYDRGLDE